MIEQKCCHGDFSITHTVLIGSILKQLKRRPEWLFKHNFDQKFLSDYNLLCLLVNFVRVRNRKTIMFHQNSCLHPAWEPDELPAQVSLVLAERICPRSPLKTYIPTHPGRSQLLISDRMSFKPLAAPFKSLLLLNQHVFSAFEGFRCGTGQRCFGWMNCLLQLDTTLFLLITRGEMRDGPNRFCLGWVCWCWRSYSGLWMKAGYTPDLSSAYTKPNALESQSDQRFALFLECFSLVFSKNVKNCADFWVIASAQWQQINKD